MLLESALADFSTTDESDCFEDAQTGMGYEWESVASTSNSPLKGVGGSNSDAAAGPAEVKYVYLDVKSPPSRRTSSDLSTTSNHSRPLSDFLGMSRSPPAVDVVSSFEISRADDNGRSLTSKGALVSGRPKSPSRRGKGTTSGCDEAVLRERMPITRDTETVPFAWEAQPGRPRVQKKSIAVAAATTAPQPKPLQLPPAARVSSFKNGKGASPSPTSSQKKDYRRMSSTPHGGRVSSSPQGRVSSTPQGRLSTSPQGMVQSSPQRRSSTSPQSGRVSSRSLSRVSSNPQSRVSSNPPSRVSSNPQRRVSSSPQGKVSASPRSRASASPQPVEVSPIRQQNKAFRPSGNAAQIKRPDVPRTPPSVQNVQRTHSRGRIQLAEDNSLNSEYKFFDEESPNSILERPPSPPTTNSSGSSGSSVHTPPRSASASTPTPPLPGVPVSRRRLPSFSSSSAQDSPRASTSSSNRYMGQCLVALQAALAIDPEKSKRFEDSFVELDTYVDGADGNHTFAKSPVDNESVVPRGKVRQGPDWARGGAARGGAASLASELEPEYKTEYFYSDSEEEIDRQSHVRSSSTTSSVGRSSSGGSISRPIRRALNYDPQVSVNEYSLKDKRFLSSHPSSWVDHGDDSISSSLTNSKCNTLTRHQDVSWDEQQADLDSVRAEEVVRGAIDGLRFTYSPVSSAFVFTRSNEGDDETASGRRGGHVSYRSENHKTFTDSEASRRFSVDYEASIYSEDSMSFAARGSDVTELGVSRAESWSKVARGIAFHQQQQQQGYQDAVPSSFVRRAGHTSMYEDSNIGGSRKLKHSQSTGAVPDHATPDSRLVRKPKKSAMTTCLPFRSILRNFRTISSPGRSRLGMAPNNSERQVQWTRSGPGPAVSRLTY